MKRLSDLEYLRLNKFARFFYNILMFFIGIPRWFLNLFKKIWKLMKKFGIAVKNEAVDIWVTFKNGDWKTKVSYLVMGFGLIARGQLLRGLLFLLFEAVFIGYMVLWGGFWLSQFGTLGTVGPHEEYDPILDVPITVYGDNSFKILLYGLLTILFIIAFIYTWRLNVKQNKLCEGIIKSGKKIRSGKDDLQSLLDDQFHKTLLALPLTGIVMFTVIPMIFMILVAFTNYSGKFDGYYTNLFTWVGLDNFNKLFTWGGDAASSSFSATFGEILSWTLIWAVFATFSNYFLGMIVAMIINKKGIKIKKFWRGVLVLTIAIPQFVSLLYVNQLFQKNGLVNGLLLKWGIIDFEHLIDFWGDHGRLMVILINIWIGIPYLMLIATGILMNIPQDLYESSKIDGANSWQQYTRITLPYMLFVTGPYLLTSFIGNINNFNVIFLLTGGGPTDPKLLVTMVDKMGEGTSAAAGHTDLLITWLFNLTTGQAAWYNIASVIGIMIFVVVAILSLIVYNVMPSTRNEEDFQ